MEESYVGGTWHGGDDIDADGEPDDEELDVYQEPDLSFLYGEGNDFQIDANILGVGGSANPQPPLSDWHNLPQGCTPASTSVPPLTDPRGASTQPYGMARSHSLPQWNMAPGLQPVQPSTALAELERRLHGNVIRVSLCIIYNTNIFTHAITY